MTLSIIVLFMGIAPIIPAQDQSLTIVGGSAASGTVFTAEVTLDNDAGSVEGYAFDVCHDDEFLEIGFGDVSEGSAIADIDFDFQAVEFEDTGWAVSAVFEVGESLDEGTGYELYTADYELLAIGLVDLTFCGDFEAANVIVDGVDETPDTFDGTIDIEDAPGFLRGDFDNNGVVEPLFDCYSLIGWLFTGTPGPDCESAADVNDDGVINLVDVIFLLNFAYADGVEPPDPGATECGADSTPDDLDCATPPDPCPGDAFDSEADEAYELTISTVEDALEGDDVTLTVNLDSTDGDVIAVQFGVCHDALLLELDVDTGVVADSVLADVGFQGLSVAEDGFSTGILASLLLFTTLNADDQDLYEVTYSVLDDSVEAPVEFCDYGDPEIAPRIITEDGDWILPTVFNGGVNLETNEAPEFMRGDVDSNGVVTTLIDVLALLGWAFGDGAEPLCRDTADIDDNGTVAALVDSLTLLNWAFGDGDDIPDPGVETCGPDPTDDDIDCETEPDACA